MHIQDHGLFLIPVESWTDCLDLYELSCGLRGIPSGKSQRLAVLAIREERLARRLRGFGYIPTFLMLADSLTKAGIFPLFMKFLTTGLWDTSFKPKKDGKDSKKHPKLRILHRKADDEPEFEEHDLVNLDR